MSLDGKLKIRLESRPNKWTPATLPGVHFDFRTAESLDVVFDGCKFTIRIHDVDPTNVAQSVGQKFFEGICLAFNNEDYGSYTDAKLLAEKVALKAARIDLMKVWLVQGK